MATLAEVRNAMTHWKPGRFTPHYNMDTLVTTGTVFLKNGETLHFEKLTPHSEMMPNAAVYLARSALTIIKEIFNALVNEVAVEGEISLGDRIVDANNTTPPVRRTPAEQADDHARQASLAGVSFLPSDIQ